MKHLLCTFISLSILSLFLSSLTFAQDIIISTTGGCLTGIGNECLILDSENNFTATSIAQDIIFAATYMVGTVLTLVIIYCGLGYIFAAKGWKDVNKYKNGLKNAMIGAVLVWGAYAIVRLIQYIAAG